MMQFNTTEPYSKSNNKVSPKILFLFLISASIPPLCFYTILPVYFCYIPSILFIFTSIMSLMTVWTINSNITAFDLAHLYTENINKFTVFRLILILVSCYFLYLNGFLVSAYIIMPSITIFIFERYKRRAKFLWRQMKNSIRKKFSKT